MADSAAPVVVALPLQGEGWVAVNAPADLPYPEPREIVGRGL